MHKQDIINLLKIQGVILKKYILNKNSLHLWVQTTSSVQTCPCCNSKTSKIHDYMNEQVKEHLKVVDLKSFIHIRKRRYECKCCGKIFIENYSFIEKNYTMTSTLANQIIDNLSLVTSIKNVGKNSGVSSQRVINILSKTCILKYVNQLPKHIGIDEFKGNSGNNKFQVVITDLDTRKVIDIIDNKSFSSLELYFSKIKNLNEVELVTMDMCPLFKQIIKLKMKNAKIIADKFHYTRLIHFALESVRKDVQNTLSKGMRIYFKHSKYLLHKRYDELDTVQKIQVDNMLKCSETLMYAHDIKEKMSELNDFKVKSEDDFFTKVKMFNEFILYTQKCDISYFNSHIKSFVDWSKEIKNSFKTNLTNGITEGLNTSIKTIKRVSYGFKNFDLFRLRILSVLS